MSAICNICGGTEFEPGFNGRIANGQRPMCTACHSVERHRIVRKVYIPLISLLRDWRALQFAPDQSVDRSWFKEYVGSTYGGHNSMNMMETGLEGGRFNIAIANHVLEHVADDTKAIAELLRVVGTSGVVHMTVPAPTYRWQTDDWGFADPNVNLHFRDYGSDFPQRIVHSIGDLACASVASFDAVTGVADLVYFFSHSSATLRSMGALWARHGFPVTQLF